MTITPEEIARLRVLKARTADERDREALDDYRFESARLLPGLLDDIEWLQKQCDSRAAKSDAPPPQSHAPDREHILQFFDLILLPPEVEPIAKQYTQLAEWLHAKLPRNPERTVMLRKLLESREAALRAYLAKPSPARGT